jgi:hypothetical protein
MFAKVFAQIFDSSIASNYLVRLVFEDMLVLADSDGVVDMTVDALSRRTNVPLEIVQAGIEELSKPDRESRTPDDEGRRIVPLDSHRSWGWRIVNYRHYRDIRNEEGRRDYMRNYMRNRRSAEKEDVNPCKPDVSSVNSGKPQLANAEAEEEVKSIEPNANALASGDLTVAKTKKLASKHSSGEIDRVYQAYPLKKGAGAARTAIGKALDRVKARGESDPTSFLVGRISDWKASRERDAAAGRFVPEFAYPTTWFNEERYDDDLSLADAKPKPVIPDKPVFEQRSTLIPMAEIRARAGIQ